MGSSLSSFHWHLLLIILGAWWLKTIWVVQVFEWLLSVICGFSQTLLSALKVPSWIPTTVNDSQPLILLCTLLVISSAFLRCTLTPSLDVVIIPLLSPFTNFISKIVDFSVSTTLTTLANNASWHSMGCCSHFAII